VIQKRKRVIVLVSLTVILAASFFLWKFRPWVEKTGKDIIEASGTVETTDVDVAFKMPGILSHRLVNEGDPVKRGELLAELDKRDAVARFHQSEAGVNTALARLNDVKQGYRVQEIAEASAQVEQLKANWINLKGEADRSRILFDGGAISRQRYDRDMTSSAVAKAQLLAGEKRLELLQSGFRENSIKAASSQLEEAKASSEAAGTLVEDHHVSSPIDGVVSRVYIEEGEMVGSGRPVLTVTNLTRPWVRVYISEKEIGRILLGMKASVKVDSFPDREFPAKVTFISPEAEFTPKSVQTQEERVKLVFAVNVTAENPEGLLKPGMPADVTIHTGTE
jgi:HlyD family secretion protein